MGGIIRDLAWIFPVGAQALAIEVYTRQAKNTEAERRACETRLCVEKKAGHC